MKTDALTFSASVLLTFGAAVRSNVNIEQRFQQGLAFHRNGQTDKAERCYEQVLRRVPGHAEALYLSGSIALQSRRFERAVTLNSAAVRADPSAASAFVNLGIALEELKRFGEALASYDRALALMPSLLEAHTNRAMVLRLLDRPEDAIECYDRAIRLRPDLAELHCNRGTVLLERQQFDDALAGFERAIRLNPGLAEAHANRGLALEGLRRLPDALVSYDRALQLNPAYPEAHCNRGKALHALGHLDEAIRAYDRATEIEPAFAAAHFNRGKALQDLDRPDDAVLSYDRAIAVQPSDAGAWSNRGIALEEAGQFRTAIASYDRAIQADPNLADAYWNKSLALLRLGAYNEGWILFEWRKKKTIPFGNANFAQPSWNGRQRIAGATLFVHWEQGLGDTMQFARFARLAARDGARVVLSVQPRLANLFRPWEPEIEILSGDSPPEAFDYHVALMSLPLALGTTWDRVPWPGPYLRADADTIAHWRPRLPSGSKPRIGFVWNGNPAHGNDGRRSMTLDDMRPLLAFEAHWICLQKDIAAPDRSALAALNIPAFPGDEQRDFADTAAIVAHLDLVIEVDTAVAHLAEAMGVPVCLLLSFVHDWRWLCDRRDTPWYPATRLYRQPTRGDWPSAIAEVLADLRERFT